MSRPSYAWAARNVPRGWWTTLELAVALGCGPRRARAQLLRRLRQREPIAGIRVFRRAWQHRGRRYVRQAYGIAPEMAALLLLERVFREAAIPGYRMPPHLVDRLRQPLRRALARRGLVPFTAGPARVSRRDSPRSRAAG